MKPPSPSFPHPARPLLTPSRQGTRGLPSGLPTPSQGVPWGSSTPFRGVPGDLRTPFRSSSDPGHDRRHLPRFPKPANLGSSESRRPTPSAPPGAGNFSTSSDGGRPSRSLRLACRPGPPHRKSARRTVTADADISLPQRGDLAGLPGNHPAAPSPNTPTRRISPPPIIDPLEQQLQPRHSAFLSPPASPHSSPERPSDSEESEANPIVPQRTNTPDAPEVQTLDRKQKAQPPE